VTYTVHAGSDAPHTARLPRLDQAERAARDIVARSPGAVVEIRWRGGSVATVRTDAAGAVWVDDGAPTDRLL
jgi:hypothetical protein